MIHVLKLEYDVVLDGMESRLMFKDGDSQDLTKMFETYRGKREDWYEY